MLLRLLDLRHTSSPRWFLQSWEVYEFGNSYGIKSKDDDIEGEKEKNAKIWELYVDAGTMLISCLTGLAFLYCNLLRVEGVPLRKPAKPHVVIVGDVHGYVI